MLQYASFRHCLYDIQQFILIGKWLIITVCVCRWCGPCKLLGPRLESMVSAQEGKVVLAKIDIDELSEIAIDHGVNN